MLIQFSVTNFKTFRDKATLSMVASSHDKKTREHDNVVSIGKPHNLRLLKSAVIYGANASGKTKLLEALAFMKRMVRESANDSDTKPLKQQPFLLNEDSKNQSSEFEVIFLLEGVRYRYGFEILDTTIVSEWLFHKPKDSEVLVFYRDEGDFESHTRIPAFRIGRKIARGGMVREQMLWLTAATIWNDELSKKVSEWFSRLYLLSGTDENQYMGVTLSHLADEGAMQFEINELARAASIGLEEVLAERTTLDQLPKEVLSEIRERIAAPASDYTIKDIILHVAKYPVYDEKGDRTRARGFTIDGDESSGTRKFLALTGPILEVLAHGSILLVDELDARLHPNLVCKLVGLFNSVEHNPKGAQLIFNTHDTNLLGSGLFRRDQIWFTEKDRYGASTLYSLLSYKPRKGEDLEKNYVLGKYGAIPYLGDFDSLQSLPGAHEKE